MSRLIKLVLEDKDWRAACIANIQVAFCVDDLIFDVRDQVDRIVKDYTTHQWISLEKELIKLYHTTDKKGITDEYTGYV